MKQGKSVNTHLDNTHRECPDWLQPLTAAGA